MRTLWDLIQPVRDAAQSLVDSLRQATRPAPAAEPERPRRPRKPRARPPAPPAALFATPAATPATPAATPPRSPRAIASRPRGARPAAGDRAARRAAQPASDTAQARYDAVVKLMLDQHGIRVRRWRNSMSGVAYEVAYRDGSTARFIESPRPKGPMSAAIFLHEIGHHAIGFNRYKPRCLEEYHAWAWSLRAMEEHGLSITDAVRRRMHQSLHYAIGKATRRGIRAVPPELHPFMSRPPRSPRSNARG
ncbi:MAG: hypothetical protein ACK5Z4_06025 [Planctomyces sp.]